MRRCLRLLAPALLLLFAPRPAHADATAFLSAVTAPEARGGYGFALGAGFLVVGIEFEYARTGEDDLGLAPSLTTGMGNLFVQSPVALGGIQLYGTVGGGFYRERLERIDRQETQAGLNLGGGAKIGLAGPLRLRLDYRFFRLAGDPIEPTVHRFYAGINLAF